MCETTGKCFLKAFRIKNSFVRALSQEIPVNHAMSSHEIVKHGDVTLPAQNVMEGQTRAIFRSLRYR